MSDQPEALRLAEYMDAPLNDPEDVADAAAAELRRLHAENDALRAEVETEHDSRGMFVVRLEKMQEQGDHRLTIVGVLALLNDCDMLAARAIERAHGIGGNDE